MRGVDLRRPWPAAAVFRPCARWGGAGGRGWGGGTRPTAGRRGGRGSGGLGLRARAEARRRAGWRAGGRAGGGFVFLVVTARTNLSESLSVWPRRLFISFGSKRKKDGSRVDGGPNGGDGRRRRGGGDGGAARRGGVIRPGDLGIRWSSGTGGGGSHHLPLVVAVAPLDQRMVPVVATASRSRCCSCGPASRATSANHRQSYRFRDGWQWQWRIDCGGPAATSSSWATSASKDILIASNGSGV